MRYYSTFRDHKWLLRQAALGTNDSDDPRTQICAIVYDLETFEILSSEPNKLSKGFEISDLEKFDKYPIMLHAEQAALYEYLKNCHPHDVGLAATAACCTECAKAIVAAEIKEVITSKAAIDAMPAWKKQIELGHKILRRAGIKLIILEDIGSEVLVSGKKVKI